MKLGDATCPICRKKNNDNRPVMFDGTKRMEGCAECHKKQMDIKEKELIANGDADRFGRCGSCNSIYPIKREDREKAQRHVRPGGCVFCSIMHGRCYILNKLRGNRDV